MQGAAEYPDASAPYIFVSYASVDRERVLPIVGALRTAGISVWLDQQGIAGGENYGTVIADAIKEAAAFVLMASPASLSSRNVKQEIALGWRFERPYLPLLLETVAIPDELAYWLEAAQWIAVLDKTESAWLPAVLAALQPLGIAPASPDDEKIAFVGRERELALLREQLISARAGKGGLALIGGVAGIGKTTLAEAVCHEAVMQGALVLIGRCYDLAETPPYGPWVELFGRYQRDDPPLPPAFAQRGMLGQVESQAALLQQVHGFITAAATSRPAGARPLVLLLDDLHWADPASLDLLRFIARTLAALPVLILATYRSDELTRRHPLYPLLPLLVRESGAARLDVRALDNAAVAVLVSARYRLPDADSARFVAYVQARAEGNALFVGELLRSLEEAGVLRQEGDAWRLGDLANATIPTLLRQVISGRLSRLDEESQRLLAVAAIIGHEVPLAVWAAVGEMDEDAVLEVAEQGLEARLLVEGESGESVRFAHALIRESLFAGIPAIRRRRIHRQVAEALIETRNPDPDAVAYHFQQAGDARAAAWLITAGERARAAYAWLTAAVRFEAALALMDTAGADVRDRGWLLYRLADVRRLDDPAASVAVLEEAQRLADEAGDRALAAHVRLSLGYTRSQSGNFIRGIPEMEAGLAAVEALAPDDVAWARERSLTQWSVGYGHLLFWLAHAGHLTEALAIVERLPAQPSSDIAQRGDGPVDDNAVSGLRGQGIALAELGQTAAARSAFVRAREVARTLDSPWQSGILRINELDYFVLPYLADQRSERERLAIEAETALTRATNMRRDFPPHYARLTLLVLEGKWDEAQVIAQTIQEGESGFGPHRQTAAVTLGLLGRLRGDVPLAWAQVHTVLSDGPATAPGNSLYGGSVSVQRLATALSLDADDLATAKEWLDAHDRWLAWSGAVLGQSEGHALWAQYHRQAGDMAQAREHAERALAHATEPRQPLALIAAHRLFGELDTDARRFDDAAAHLDESLRLADACAAPYERALTLLAIAELRAATGETAQTRTLLDEVRAICAPLGAKPALARADALAEKIATENG